MKKALATLLLTSVAFTASIVCVNMAEIAMAASTTAADAYIFYVYKDFRSSENHYPDIAFMGSKNNGNDGSLSVNADSIDKTQSGESCIEISYSPKDESHWAGMMWLSGKNNYPPNRPVNGVDASQAEKLTFWARGSGSVKFYIEDDNYNQVEGYEALTDDWEQYALEIPPEWDAVCVGFGWALGYSDVAGESATFYVDEIRFEGERNGA